MNSVSGNRRASVAAQPDPEDWIRWLAGPLSSELDGRYGDIHVTFLSRATSVVDGTTVLLVRDGAGRSRAVVLCSSPVAPDMVWLAMERARGGKVALGPMLGAPILDTLASGRIQGLSYAALPYCNPLSNARVVWWVQRALLRRKVLDWLWRATDHTVCEPDAVALESRFSEPLRRLASIDCPDARLRACAAHAGERFASGAWSPRCVLEHGDFWKGNILVRPSEDGAVGQGWSDRFAIIDWAGADVRGHAIFDLVRLAESLPVPARILRGEVERHCRVLECEPGDAKSYLLAALGHVFMNLEHFPLNRFVQMALDCLDTLERGLAA